MEAAKMVQDGRLAELADGVITGVLENPLGRFSGLRARFDFQPPSPKGFRTCLTDQLRILWAAMEGS
jgi:hypothetical protein